MSYSYECRWMQVGWRSIPVTTLRWHITDNKINDVAALTTMPAGDLCD